ncbi:MAG: hypothetical protein U0325_07005 [Polyangiales bacterium]
MPAMTSLRPGVAPALLGLSALLAVGCRRPASPPRPATDVPATQRDATPRRRAGPEDVSPPRGDAGAASATTLTWSRDGLAAAWIEGDAVRAWQRVGTRWVRRGVRVNDHAAAGLVRLVAGPEGELAAAWTERAENGGTAVRFARWQGGRWTELGSLLNEPAATTTVTALVLSGSAQSPMVAMILEGPAGNPITLRAVRWRGVRWENAGPPSLVPPGARVQTLNAAQCGEGRSLLGWIEIGATGTPLLSLRAWNPQQNTWIELPRSDAPLIDAGTHTLAMACDDDGRLSLGYGWSGGTHGVRRWSPASDTWQDLGLPRDTLRAASLDAGPWLAWQGETLWMSWRPRGGGLAAAVHREGAWRVLGESLDDRDGRGVEAALDPTGTLYVSGRGPSAAVAVASLRAASARASE